MKKGVWGERRGKKPLKLQGKWLVGAAARQKQKQARTIPKQPPKKTKTTASDR